MDDINLRIDENMRRVARAITPDTVARKRAAVEATFDDSGNIKAEALSRSLPPYLVTWFLAGAMSNGTNKEREIELPTESRITSIRLRAKTAPVSAECTVVVRGNGASIGSASIPIGNASGRSVGINVAVAAGTVLTVDVTSPGGSDVTITVTYVPIAA